MARLHNFRAKIGHLPVEAQAEIERWRQGILPGMPVLLPEFNLWWPPPPLDESGMAIDSRFCFGTDHVVRLTPAEIRWVLGAPIAELLDERGLLADSPIRN
jgi:hypothetical protein